MCGGAVVRRGKKNALWFVNKMFNLFLLIVFVILSIL